MKRNLFSQLLDKGYTTMVMIGLICTICNTIKADTKEKQPYTIADEGAWCWFADPRALHYESKDGSINKSYIGYIDIHGAIKAMQYDFNTKTQEEVLIRSYFQPDDHNNPTFLILPDEQIGRAHV